MKTITAEQFAKTYGKDNLDSLDQNGTISQQVDTPQTDNSLTNIVGKDISERTDRVGEILNRKDTGAITKGVQVFGQGAGMAANTLEQTALKVPGVKQVVNTIGKGIDWLTTSDSSPIKALGEVIGSNKTLQTAVHLYDTDQNFKDSVDAVSNIVRLGGDVDTAVNSANFATNVTNKIIKNVKNVSSDTATKVSNTVSSINTKPATVAIMNRVARLTPNDINQFKLIAKKTPGEYLVDTGNFGSPDKIIMKEAEKFTKSKNMVDTELAKLPGVYKNSAVGDALSELSEVAKNTSSPNVKSPFFDEVDALIKKNNAGGLTMNEINDVKRLLEQKVKLGYNKALNPDKIAKATNIDSAIRDWQVGTAKKLGFRNLDEMNKQTQLSKFIVNKLGSKVIGESALNNLGLTDWIVLAGGSPQAVAGFLTKRFFSSRAVQARIAQILNSSGNVKSIITPDIQPTVESALRRQWPEGNRLELPVGNSPVKQVNTPIELRGQSTTEAPAQVINRQLPPLDKTLRLNAAGQNPIELKGPQNMVKQNTKSTQPQQVKKVKSP